MRRYQSTSDLCNRFIKCIGIKLNVTMWDTLTEDRYIEMVDTYPSRIALDGK